MRQVFGAIVAVAMLLGIGDAAKAQSLLKRFVDRTAQQTEEEVQSVVRDTIASGLRGDGRGENGSSPDPEGEGAETGAVEPSPAAAVPTVAKKAAYIDALRVPPEVEAQKASYNKFGEVRCNDCEGGIDFDGRPKFAFDQFSGQYNERAKRAGNWPVGHVHRWQGKAAKGTLTVTREEEVEGFRCRRLDYRLDKGSASASRPGLICFGLANRSSGIENWHEVY